MWGIAQRALLFEGTGLILVFMGGVFIVGRGHEPLSPYLSLCMMSYHVIDKKNGNRMKGCNRREIAR